MFRKDVRDRLSSLETKVRVLLDWEEKRTIREAKKKQIELREKYDVGIFGPIKKKEVTYDDFKRLLDHLNVEIIDTPASRTVRVKEEGKNGN